MQKEKLTVLQHNSLAAPCLVCRSGGGKPPVQFKLGEFISETVGAGTACDGFSTATSVATYMGVAEVEGVSCSRHVTCRLGSSL